MTQKKHIGILEKFEKLDQKQQAKQRSRLLVIASLLLPFIGWGLGVIANPTGWLSHIGDMLTYTAIVLIFFWYVSVPILVAIVILLVKRKYQSAAGVLFIASVAYACFLFIETSSASENEFA